VSQQLNQSTQTAGRAAAPQENIMGTMAVNPLLIKLSVPMMISMLVQALYNVVDSVFVSHVSENALTAVSLAFSLQNVMIAVGVGTGVGVNALLSKSLGEHDQKQVNRAATNGLFLSVVSCLVFMLIGFTCLRPYFAAQTTDADILQQGVDYLAVCCIFSQGLFLSTMMEKLLASTGRTKYSMISQLVGAVVNIVLDPIFIFGYCGEALSGTRGAAVATVIGQFCGAFVGIYCNLRKNPEIQLRFKGFRPHPATIRRVYAVGLPSIAMQCVGSVMTFGMNRILMAFSATAVAVFGVYFKLQSFVFMPIFGMNNGVVPIISYNYGARKPDRMKQTIKLAVLYAECIMLIGVLIFQFLPDKVLSIFAASDTMLALGEPALRIISIHFLLAGIGIIFSSTFQALGEGLYSLYISLCRQLVVLLPVAYLLSRTGNVNAVWWAFPIAETFSLTLSVVFMLRTNKTIIAPLYASRGKAAD
jgi:putative MATE family efflux protein